MILGTGFMGKVLIEKLLRKTEIGKIYMLMRVKKGKNQEERLVDTFNNPVRRRVRLKFMKIILNYAQQDYYFLIREQT
jgi:thioester reductase-like protein